MLTFRVSLFASGRRITKRFKACSCCFLVGRSANKAHSAQYFETVIYSLQKAWFLSWNFLQNAECIHVANYHSMTKDWQILVFWYSFPNVLLGFSWCDSAVFWHCFLDALWFLLYFAMLQEGIADGPSLSEPVLQHTKGYNQHCFHSFSDCLHSSTISQVTPTEWIPRVTEWGSSPTTQPTAAAMANQRGWSQEQRSLTHIYSRECCTKWGN